MLHPAVFLVHYLTLMSMTSVFAVSTSHTLTRTSHSVVVPFTRIIFPAFNVFEAHAHSTKKKKPTDGLSYGRAGNPNPTYFSVRPNAFLFSAIQYVPCSIKPMHAFNLHVTCVMPGKGACFMINQILHYNLFLILSL